METIPSPAENEDRFYPDQTDLRWQLAIFTTLYIAIAELIVIAVSVEYIGIGILSYIIFFILALSTFYTRHFVKIGPKLYIDKNHTYLRVVSAQKDEKIFIKDIKNYSYFECYKNPSEYPFLSTCVQLNLHNGNQVEFFAFFRGADLIIKNKMKSLGIEKKS